MKAASTVLLVIFLVSAPIKSAAQESGMMLTGAEFLSACSRPDPEWIGFCHGYVQAVFDGGEDICASAELTRAKIVGAVVQHLATVPELESLNAASVVYAVLLKTHPCQGS